MIIYNFPKFVQDHISDKGWDNNDLVQITTSVESILLIRDLPYRDRSPLSVLSLQIFLVTADSIEAVNCGNFLESCLAVF